MPCIRELLSEDADLAWVPFFEHGAEPPVCFASRAGTLTPELLDLLTAHGADVGAMDARGRTALILASAGMEHHGPLDDFWAPGLRLGLPIPARNPELLYGLVDAGADPMHADLSGTTAVDVLCEQGRIDLARALLRRATTAARIALLSARVAASEGGAQGSAGVGGVAAAAAASDGALGTPQLARRAMQLGPLGGDLCGEVLSCLLLCGAPDGP